MTIGLTSRLRLIHPNAYLHWCPACMKAHQLIVGMPACDERTLGYDGDWNMPTFYPEVEHVDANGKVCRYELRGGRLIFNDLCTHDLAGKEFELPYFPLS